VHGARRSQRLEALVSRVAPIRGAATYTLTADAGSLLIHLRLAARPLISAIGSKNLNDSVLIPCREKVSWL
jgi:hypothetical protein